MRCNGDANPALQPWRPRCCETAPGSGEAPRRPLKKVHGRDVRLVLRRVRQARASLGRRPADQLPRHRNTGAQRHSTTKAQRHRGTGAQGHSDTGAQGTGDRGTAVHRQRHRQRRRQRHTWDATRCGLCLDTNAQGKMQFEGCEIAAPSLAPGPSPAALRQSRRVPWPAQAPAPRPWPRPRTSSATGAPLRPHKGHHRTPSWGPSAVPSSGRPGSTSCWPQQSSWVEGAGCPKSPKSSSTLYGTLSSWLPQVEVLRRSP